MPVLGRQMSGNARVALPASAFGPVALGPALDDAGDAAAHAAERVASLDVLRGLMALAVATYHLGAWTQAFEGGARSAAVVLGVYSVEGFFLISGFCFFHLYSRTSFDLRELGRFHLKRFLRIAPLYYCALLLGVVFALDQTVGPRVSFARVIENLTLGFGLVHPNHSMVIGGWSIGIEYVFYLALPALIAVTRLRPLLYLLAVLLVLWAIPYNFGIVEGAADPRKFHAYVQVPNHAFLFLLGAIVADLHARIRARLPLMVLVTGLLSIGWSAALAQPDIATHLDVMVGAARVKYVALCALTVLLFAFTRLPTTGAFRVLGGLGDLSYSVYLMHPFAWRMIEPWLPAQSPALARLGCGLCATLVLAALTRRWLEEPFNALARKLTRGSSRRGR